MRLRYDAPIAPDTARLIMFTHKTLPISDLAKGRNLRVLRDAEVAYVAKVPYPLPNRLVPCGALKHIRAALRETGIVAMVTPEALIDQAPAGMGLVVADNPLAATLDLHEALIAREDFQWQSFETRIDPSARVHPAAHVVGRDVEIGPDVRIDPGAVIMPRTIIGARSIIGPGTVVGCDAFHVFKKNGVQRVIRQSGGVRIGADVELQANCTVSRAVFGGFTEIGDQALLDSQIHVGHDCRIGRKVSIANQASLAGRVIIQDGVYIAPNVTISNGLTLGEGTQVTIGSVLLQNTKPGQKVTGYNAQPHDQWMMQTIRARRQK